MEEISIIDEEKRIRDFENSLLSIDRIAAWKVINKEIKSHTPYEIVERIIVPALERIGIGWEKGEIALSQNYMASKITEEIVEKILPRETSSRKTNPKIATATLGDYHLLGKRMITSFMRSSGFEVTDFGTAEPLKIIEKIEREKIDVLLISILMLNLTERVKELRNLLDKRNLDVKIIVGGAPFSFDPELYLEVGADSMATSMADVLTSVNKVTGRDVY